MNRHFVNGALQLSNGAQIEFCSDDQEVKAVAKRLDLYSQMVAGLGLEGADRGAAGLRRDGDSLIAILAWQGFADNHSNGWMSVKVTPVCDENCLLLEEFARVAIGALGPTH